MKSTNGLNPLRLLANVFSSIWLGVILLTLLFIYSSIGSSGVPIHPNIFDPAHWVSVRQMRPFELTEFEWFNWWPFDLLIALICVNLVVATLRRIPFNALNFGVWMIHSGIIILCLGSVWYFGTKVEGDAPILRRRVVIEAPGGLRTSIPAIAGVGTSVGSGADRYVVQVMSIDPRWELLSGEEKGDRAYKVSVMVQGKGGSFVRELIANRPQYTQDLIMSGDQNQPMQRAIKVTGKPLVDEALKLTLDYDPQKWFYRMDSRALYLRELDSNGQPRTGWIQRPIPSGGGRGQLPRYNDHVAASDDVWMSAGESGLPLLPLNVAAPPDDANDPLPGVTLRVSRYLRYASLQTRHPIDPTGPINPRINLTMLSPTGQTQSFTLAAFDPQSNHDLEGNLVFFWADDAASLERLKTRVDPVLRFSVPGSDKVIEETVDATMARDPNLPFKPIEGTGYSYRVENVQDDLNLGSGPVSLAIVQLKSPGGATFTRWVFDDPKFNRDLAMTSDAQQQHNAEIATDPNILATYRKGSFPPAPIVVVAGPGENDLAVCVTKATGQPTITPVKPGDVVDIVNGVTLRIDQYAPRTRDDMRPMIVPRDQRDRQMGEMMSMIYVELPAGVASGVTGMWLPYHHFAFDNPDETLRRFPYRPTTISLADGRRLQVMFARERLPLPAPVVLDDFAVDTHIGGFTGSTSSIMDWQSLVRFQGEDGQWLPPQSVRVNKPTEFDGYWFFQAQWDPPEPPRGPGDPGSAGLNYTVLGVGNRNGVHVMLAGCCIAVFGMIWSFYWKPVLKRRRQQAIYAQVRTTNALDTQSASNVEHEREPVGAAWRVQP